MAAPPRFADVAQMAREPALVPGDTGSIPAVRANRSRITGALLMGAKIGGLFWDDWPQERPVFARRPWLEGITTDEGGNASPWTLSRNVPIFALPGSIPGPRSTLRPAVKKPCRGKRIYPGPGGHGQVCQTAREGKQTVTKR